jgi:hypothetical protein
MRMVDAVRRAVGTGRGGAPERLGTVLSLESQRLVEALWRNELEFVPFGDKTADAAALPEASRRQEIFLDYLLSQTATASRHLLDPAVARARTQADEALADVLTDLERRLDGAPRARESSAWPAVAKLLQDLGGARPKRR